jgi:hypothetical protein
MGLLEHINNEHLKSTNLEYFYKYYRLMMCSGDCDPAFPMLNYVCDRFELNLEQRFWLAFLYGTNYCGPTVYYIYNEFPDFENVSMARVRRWWKQNKQKTLFQTDRAKVKNFNYFADIVKSYINLVGSCQEDTIRSCKTYDDLYDFASKIFYFGRFSIFNYTQALWELTNVRYEPTFFNLKEAESCRNGLCYVFNKKHYIVRKSRPRPKIDYDELQRDLSLLLKRTQKKTNKIPVNIWNVETALCAFKKLFWGSRYLGYYIDRQLEEIKKLENNVTEGVCWEPLWDFRKEFFDHRILGEVNGWNGIRKNLMYLFRYRRMLSESILMFDRPYKRKVNFPRTGECYEILSGRLYLWCRTRICRCL